MCISNLRSESGLRSISIFVSGSKLLMMESQGVLEPMLKLNKPVVL